MTDPIAPTAVVVAPVAAPAVTSPAPGWKSTEAWLAMFMLGVLAYAIEQVTTLLPTIMANPAIPAWVTPIVPFALAALAWVGHKVLAKYTDARVALKLDANSADVSSAIAAGKAAGGADLAVQLAQLNK